MNLVIVESPTKAKTISKFLGKEYQVESSYGHIRDLPKSKLGIDVENNFEPQYIIPTKARKTVSHLREAASKADVVVLATDEDREGEAIGWHLAQALKLDTKNTKRIVFHEITKSAIEHALKKPRVLDMNLVDAQQARRILDRLVGYKLSPFLWKKVMRGLSAGRVQSVTVRLIVDREIEIRSFKPQEYWTITVELSKNGEALEANLIKINDRILDKFEIANQETAEKITKDLEGKQFMVEKMEQTEFKKNPPPPFITSTLQQDAARRLGFSSKKTMFIAQRLYEHGLITYMRTDSVNLSKDSLTAAQEWLEKEFGKEYSSPRQYESKSRLAQEAHEAVRPTDIEKKPEDLPDETDKKLYRLIWQRFLASQMSPARVATTVIDVKAEEYGLRASGQRILFDGFLKVWTQKVTEKTLPAVDNGEQLDFKKIDPSQHFTEPPPRYSEATLIKALEEHGIGRPSTYAPTISTIQTRNYVTKEKGRFVPTETGELVNKVLTEHFPQIVDISFTAQMEDGLDNVANGKEKWQELIALFYSPFAKLLEEKYQSVEKQGFKDEPTDQVCDKCGKPMIIKLGRFGKFIACSGFPECKNTKQLPKEPPKQIGMKCPKCGAEIVERRVSRGRVKGKIFWGCEKYPKCDYASWTDPRLPPEDSAKKEYSVEAEVKKEETETNTETEENPSTGSGQEKKTD